MSKFKSIGTWVVIVLLAFAFGAAGTAKLMGVPMLHESFLAMGLPAWFGYFIGACELAGAVGLLVRQFSAAAGVGLALVMVGAIGYHISYTPLGEAVPAVVLLALSVWVVSLRKKDSIWFAAA